MDKELLVSQAQELTKYIDLTKAKPKAVMLVQSQETGNWRLWIVPEDEKINKQEFYRIVADEISRNDISSIDVGFVEISKSDDPAMRGLGMMMRVDGISSVQVANNTYNGVLLPDGVIIRMNLSKPLVR